MAEQEDMELTSHHKHIKNPSVCGTILTENYPGLAESQLASIAEWGNSLVVQWLGLSIFTAEVWKIFGPETKTHKPHNAAKTKRNKTSKAGWKGQIENRVAGRLVSRPRWHILRPEPSECSSSVRLALRLHTGVTVPITEQKPGHEVLWRLKS